MATSRTFKSEKWPVALIERLWSVRPIRFSQRASKYYVLTIAFDSMQNQENHFVTILSPIFGNRKVLVGVVCLFFL